MPQPLDIGTLLAHLGVDTSGLKKAGRAVDDFANRTDRKMAKTKKATDGLSASFKGLAGTITSIVGTYGVSRIASHFVDTAKSFEQMELQLEKLTKGRGVQTLEEINAWAKTVPVNTKQAVDAFVKLKAYGLDPSIKTLETMVDVGVFFGQDVIPRISLALGQMAAYGRINMQDINQLAQAGIGARAYLKEAFGTSVAEEINNAGVAIRDVIKVITTGIERDFGGSAKKAVDTWQGVVSLLESSILEIERQFAKAGLFQALKDIMKDITERLDLWLRQQIALKEQGLPNWFDEVAVSARELSNTLLGIIEFFGEIIGFGKRVYSTFKPVADLFNDITLGLYDVIGNTKKALKFVDKYAGLRSIMSTNKQAVELFSKDQLGMSLDEFRTKGLLERQKIVNERIALLKSVSEMKAAHASTDLSDGMFSAHGKDKKKSDVEIPDLRHLMAKGGDKKLIEKRIKLENLLNSQLKELTMERLAFFDWETKESLAAIAKKYGEESKAYETLAAIRLEERRGIVKEQIQEETQLQNEAAEDRASIMDNLKDRQIRAMADQFEARRMFLQKERNAFIDKYAEDIELLSEFGKTYEAELDKLDADHKEWLKKQKEENETWSKDMEHMFDGWGNSFASTLNDMFWGAKVTFAEIAKEFAKMITQMAAQRATAQTLDWIVSGISSVWGAASAGGGSGAGGVEALTGRAKGGIFGPSGIVPFAKGGIVSSPTLFPFARGGSVTGMGLMGEEGHEGILPLGRNQKGELGVKSIDGEEREGGVGVTNINIFANDSKSFEDMVRRNPGAILKVVEQDLTRNRSLRSTIRNVI